MKRIMVNLDDATGDLVEQRAVADRRSASSYIALVVEKDLRAAGLLPAEPATDRAELLAQINAELDEDPDAGPELKKFLRTRRRRTARAVA